jgi:hypothetical protein
MVELLSLYRTEALLLLRTLNPREVIILLEPDGWVMKLSSCFKRDRHLALTHTCQLLAIV